MPFILLAIILVALGLGPTLPLMIQQGLYSISLSIKAGIIMLLPLIIFALLFKATVFLSKGAGKIIGLILLLVCCSNVVSTFLSHYVGAWIYHFDMAMILPQETSRFTSLWTLNLPSFIANDKAMFAGLILGILVSTFQPVRGMLLAKKMEEVIDKVLKGIVFVIPLFIIGFVLKLQADGVMALIIKDYSLIFALIALAQFAYIASVYWLLNSGRLSEFMLSIKNMIPAAISGFTTMSSAASLPLTLLGAKNNANNKALAEAVIPATVNIHLVGDCFAIPIFAYAILKSFGIAEPSLLQYVMFMGYFVLAKFSVAAIPGGGIIVMLPILESHLGFRAEMMSLITALYILFDPVITCANVLGNGAFAKLIDRLFSAPLSVSDDDYSQSQPVQMG